MKRPRFVSGGFYHVYNRGVEKRKIFMDDKDRFRFIHDLFEFNDHRPAPNMNFHYGGSTSVVEKEVRGKRDPLISLLAYALMSNHYHLLVQATNGDSVSAFMKKLGTGYTMYFNERYRRSGVLFQGRYQIRSVEEDRYLRHLVTYIHANPRELSGASREQAESSARAGQAMNFLKQYRWSSFQDYVGEKNFPSLIHWERVDQMGLSRGGRHFTEMRDWLAYRKERGEDLDNLLIDFGG